MRGQFERDSRGSSIDRGSRRHSRMANDEKIALFLRMMAVCQTVVPEKNEKGEIEYQARVRI